jgi:hypothetical protein
MERISSYVENAKWVTRADAIVGTFPALLRRLTEQSKIASEDLLNQNFEQLFEQESLTLRAPLT